jgi:hypothetical protein
MLWSGELSLPPAGSVAEEVGSPRHRAERRSSRTRVEPSGRRRSRVSLLRRPGIEASRVSDGSDGELFETAGIDRIDGIRLP